MVVSFFFFFQAEDGIRDLTVTGVQTCALPIFGMITGLIRAGAARVWGTFFWSPEQMERAWQIAEREGVPGPVATQPPYSLVHREVVDDPAMRRLAADRGVAIVASYTLAGRLLAGQYDQEPRAGRAAG